MKNKVYHRGETSQPIICPICLNKSLNEGLKYLNPYWSDIIHFNHLEVITCGSCGFSFSWPELNDELVQIFYFNEYRRKNSPFFVDLSQYRIPQGFNSSSLAQILLAKSFTSFNEGDLFVDLGPGIGHSFTAASFLLKSPTSVAIEMNSGMEKALKRLFDIETYRTFNEFLDNNKRKVKIMLLSHSLEHFKLSWLENFLNELKSVITRDGVILIEVPNVDMRIHSKWRFNDSPHFLFFSKESLMKLFESHGWRILFCDTVGALWEPAGAEYVRHSSKKKTLRRVLREYLGVLSKNVLPAKIQRAIRKALRGKYILSSLPGQEFSYGGNRTCLRLVVGHIENSSRPSTVETY